MKNVLIVEAAPMFREFLKDKLSEEKVEVNVIADKQDSIIKMNSLLPDLTIFDIDENENIDYFIELLSKIKENPKFPTDFLPKSSRNYDGQTEANLALMRQKKNLRPLE